MSDLRAFAKQWANAEVAAVVASMLNLGNTVLNAAEEGYVADALENMGGIEGADVDRFEVLVVKELNAMLKKFEADSGDFIL